MPAQISIQTPGRSLTNITGEIDKCLQSHGGKDGVLHLLIQHTSASLVIQENADPDVHRDLLDYFDQIAPQSSVYRHSAEGPDDMPAHIKSALTSTSLSIPVSGGKMMLGTWQGIYLFEHRRAPHKRSIAAVFSPAD
ncbi:MAG: YjbQ family protein [Marinicaulis sp.]|nr:YjbQ family protein [Marinicaulis sp.]